VYKHDVACAQSQVSNQKMNMGVQGSSVTNHGLALCCSGYSRARPFRLGVEQTRVSQRDSLSAGSCICPPRYLSIGVGTSSTKKTRSRPHSWRSVEQSHGVDGERGRSDVGVVDLVEMKAGLTFSMASNSHWTLPRA
jgi:hypothetical protein